MSTVNEFAMERSVAARDDVAVTCRAGVQMWQIGDQRVRVREARRRNSNPKLLMAALAQRVRQNENASMVGHRAANDGKPRRVAISVTSLRVIASPNA